MKQIYRIPKSLQFLFFFGLCFFTFLSIVSLLGKSGTIAAFGLGLFALIFLYAYWWSTSFVEIDEHRISFYRWGISKSIPWSEIGSANDNNLESDMILLSTTGDIKIRISSQISGYTDIIRLLKNKRPDLWRKSETTIFRQNMGPLLYFVLIGIICIIPGVKGLLEGKWISIILLALGFVLFYSLAQINLRVEIRDKDLVLRTLLREKILCAKDIRDISFKGEESMTPATVHAVMIELANGKTERLANFREGTLLLYNKLINWLEKHRKNTAGIEGPVELPSTIISR
jgi:hypothetical protein